MGMTLTTAANAIWLQSTAPWWVFLMAVFILREPIVRRDLIPLVFGLLGVGLILGFEFSQGTGHGTTGVICGLASGFFYSSVLICMRSLRGENPVWLVALCHLVAAGCLLPWMLSRGTWPSVPQLVVLAAFGEFHGGPIPLHDARLAVGQPSGGGRHRPARAGSVAHVGATRVG